MKLAKIALLVESTALGKGVQSIMRPLFDAKGLAPVLVEEYKPGDLDFTVSLNKARSAGAQALIIWFGNTTDVVRYNKNMQSMGWDVPVLGPSSLADSAVLESVGAAALQKSYGLSQRSLAFSDNQPLPKAMVDFREKVRAKLNGEKPLKTAIVLPAAFYDTMYVIKAAAEKAGSVEGDKLKAEMEKITQWQGVYATWTFSSTSHRPLGDDDGTMVVAASCDDAACKKAPNAP
ncbi:MAG: hypothetical protein EPO21_24575 [Chloroflexota bacterium]|nr:MAG: hypothetical protein EPO21_24575 [Chloroflexota bacterium]